MNTPRTKKPIRFKEPEPIKRTKYKSRTFGIIPQDIAARYGFAISYWPQVEERVVVLLAELITGAPPIHGYSLPARHIFHSIVSQSARIAVMRSLLENSPPNSDKPILYDELITEFARLNKKRNNYVHGLWWTSEGDVIHASPKDDAAGFFGEDEVRVVTLGEIEEFITEMQNFFTVLDRRREDGVRPSP